MIFRDSVKVERNGVTGVSPTGAPNIALVTIISQLPCDIQPVRIMARSASDYFLVMPKVGQTSLTYRTMFCNIADIRAGDVVTDLNTGTKYKVINVNSYNLFRHMEITLQGGVV